MEGGQKRAATQRRAHASPRQERPLPPCLSPLSSHLVVVRSPVRPLRRVVGQAAGLDRGQDVVHDGLREFALEDGTRGWIGVRCAVGAASRFWGPIPSLFSLSPTVYPTAMLRRPGVDAHETARGGGGRQARLGMGGGIGGLVLARLRRPMTLAAHWVAAPGGDGEHGERAWVGGAEVGWGAVCARCDELVATAPLGLPSFDALVLQPHLPLQPLDPDEPPPLTTSDRGPRGESAPACSQAPRQTPSPRVTAGPAPCRWPPPLSTPTLAARASSRRARRRIR